MLNNTAIQDCDQLSAFNLQKAVALESLLDRLLVSHLNIQTETINKNVSSQISKLSTDISNLNSGLHKCEMAVSDLQEKLSTVDPANVLGNESAMKSPSNILNFAAAIRVEIKETESRMNNLIIMGVMELNSSYLQAKFQTDYNNVMSLLSNNGDNLSNLRCERIGKEGPNKIRQLCVILNSRAVFKVISASKKFPEGIRVTSIRGCYIYKITAYQITCYSTS